MSTARRALRKAASAVVMITALTAAFAYPPTASLAANCDMAPTGVQVTDDMLHFTVPRGLMPDRKFDNRPAELQVHRVRPVYAHKCRSVPNRAAVLIHGRTYYGPAVFDLRQPTPEGPELSLQKALAWAGIDTFAPNLLGYGGSTRFDDGLDDPANASLPAYELDGVTCGNDVGCDRTHVFAFPTDQQETLLSINPLGGQLRRHSSNFRFARVDTFVRDIRQVIDYAIAQARPSDRKVTLVGYSAGGQQVARTLYKDNPVLPHSDKYIAKVNRVVFLSSLFLNNSIEEVTPPTGWASFPLHVFKTDPATLRTEAWPMPADRDAACTGHVVPGSPEQLGAQIMEEETVGRQWGGTDSAHPTGLARSPVFSSYGWTTDVAKALNPSTPTLVIHGEDDVVSPAVNASTIYNSLPVTMTSKVLVKVKCAGHALLWEGCSGSRCAPAAPDVPYGGTPGTPWAGPQATLKAALIEWIKSGTFNDESNGQFTVNESGVVS